MIKFAEEIARRKISPPHMNPVASPVTPSGRNNTVLPNKLG